MSQSRRWVWSLAAGAIALGIRGSGQPAQAVAFNQTEVDQSKFVAIAVPRASGYYTLLVLEQRSNKKQCWRESGSSPTRVEPLLLNFNFTGICGRSADSNGYSIRAAGQDLGMSYQLSVQKQKNDVLLLGIPARSGKGKTIELGRTNGVRSGFLKIQLKSGWRFTKRTYSGKTLGHVYFSRDTAPTDRVAARPERTTSAKKAVSKSDAPSASSVAKPSEQKISAKKVVDRSDSSSPSPASVSGQYSYLVMVIASTPTQQAKLRVRQPNAFRTSHQGQSVMQVGTFGDRTKAESLKKALIREGFKVLLITRTAGSLSSLGGMTIPAESTALNLDPIAVPNKKLPNKMFCLVLR
jgi:N-acetylmuramoyl-L-alanine amidase